MASNGRTDFREFFDRDLLAWWELGDREWTVQIVKFAGGTVGHGKQKSKKLYLWFRGAKKPMACNVTNGKTIASMHGRIVQDWIGKTITIYPDPNVEFGGRLVGGIRVRPVAPSSGPETFKETPVDYEADAAHRAEIEDAKRAADIDAGKENP